jgi:hypothetical protein
MTINPKKIREITRVCVTLSNVLRRLKDTTSCQSSFEVAQHCS